MDRDAARGRKGLRLAKNQPARSSSSPTSSITARPSSLRVTEILCKDQQSEGKVLSIGETVQGDSRGSLPTRRNEMRASDASYDPETSGSGDLARRHSLASVGSSNGSRQSAPQRTNHDRTVRRGSPVSTKRFTDSSKAPRKTSGGAQFYARVVERSGSMANMQNQGISFKEARTLQLAQSNTL